MEPTEERLLTPGDVARLANRTPDAVHAAIRAGRLRARLRGDITGQERRMAKHKAQFEVPGFEPGTPDATVRGIISLYGSSSTGKSTLARLFPSERWAIQDIDFGAHRTPAALVGEYAHRTVSKRYMVVTTKAPKAKLRGRSKTVEEQDAENALYTQESERINKELLQRFEDDYRTLLQSKADTIIWDKASEVWKMVRASYAGRIISVPQVAYTDMNSRYRGWIREAAAAEKTLILIHAMKDEYREFIDNRGTKQAILTGRQIPDWMRETEALSDVVLLCRRILPREKENDRAIVTEKRYEVEIVKGGEVGITLDLTDESGYKADAWLDIGALVAPDIDPSLWELR